MTAFPSSVPVYLHPVLRNETDHKRSLETRVGASCILAETSTCDQMLTGFQVLQLLEISGLFMESVSSISRQSQQKKSSNDPKQEERVYIQYFFSQINNKFDH